MAYIPLSVPVINGNEKKYLNDCLDTGWVSSVGEYVNRFEAMCAGYLNKKYAVACVNGTAALHTALMVAGVSQDDEVIMPSLTFAAPAFAVRYTGAYPVFVDVEPDYWQIDVNQLRNFLISSCTFKNKVCINKHTNRCIKAVLAVDILGHPADLDAILDLACDYNLVVIEDNAESLGSSYKEVKTGHRADITCLSFNGNKIVTAGGGGMLLTNKEQYAQKARYLTTQAKDHALEYIHEEVGYNYRLTNIQAALGLAQLEQLDSFVSAKRAIADKYRQALGNIKGVTVMKEAPWAMSSFWLYSICINAEETGVDNRTMLTQLHELGIQTRPLWHPLPGLKPFKQCYATTTDVVNRLYQQVLSLPSSANLTAVDQDYVITSIRKLCR